MKNKEIRKILKFDALHEAELVTGKSYKEDKMTEALGFYSHVKNGEIKKELLESMGDSTFSNTEENYLKIVKSIGFKSVLVEPFKNQDGVEERLHIMWNKTHSILLIFDTFTWKDDGSWAKSGKEVPPPNVNGGNFYYNWVPKTKSAHKYTSSGGYIGNGDSNKSYSYTFDKNLKPHFLPTELRSIEPKWTDDYEKWSINHKKWTLKVEDYIKTNKLVGIWSGSHDCREAIKFNINGLLNNGMFVKKWREKPFLWLLHYMDTKDSGYDYKKINEERINKLPKYVIKAICG